MSSRELDEYFEGRPKSREIFEILAVRISALGDAEMTVGYRSALDESGSSPGSGCTTSPRRIRMACPPHARPRPERDSEHVREVAQIGERRWNHQSVVRTKADARSRWLAGLLSEAYQYGGG